MLGEFSLELGDNDQLGILSNLQFCPSVLSVMLSILIYRSLGYPKKRRRNYKCKHISMQANIGP